VSAPAEPLPGTGPLPVAAANDAEAAVENAIERKSVVKRTVDDMYRLLVEGHDLRQGLIDQGLDAHLINAMIGLSLQDKAEELEKMLDSAFATLQKKSGQDLAKNIEQISDSERDLRYSRHIAKEQGFDVQALNNLTQLMRKNPGDGGVAAVNTLVAYAELSQIPHDRRQAVRRLVGDMIWGIVITVAVMWLVL